MTARTVNEVHPQGGQGNAVPNIKSSRMEMTKGGGTIYIRSASGALLRSKQAIIVRSEELFETLSDTAIGYTKDSLRFES